MKTLSCRRIPDRGSVGALLEFQGRPGEWLNSEALRVVGGPTRCGDFDDAGIIERALLSVEVWIFPHGDQFRIPDGVGPGGLFKVHGVTDRRQLAITAWLALVCVSPDDVIYLLVHV